LKPQTVKRKVKLPSVPPGVARVATAVIALPILIASIVVPWLSWLFVVLAALGIMVALSEFWLLAGWRHVKVDAPAGYLATTALLAVFYFNEPGKLPDLVVIQAILILLVIGTLTEAMLRGAPFDKMIMSTGAVVLGVLYVALLGGHLIAVRTSFQPALSTHLLLFFFLVIMGGDAAAYYAGMAFGRNKLAPQISPAKTWEGAIAGMLASLLLAALTHFWFFPELPVKFALPLAAVMNVLGVLGDLAESALKRGAGKKDTAKILPGHGGLLDRMDSLLFNAPVIYYFARVYFK
jgi:phosphatidate cytidylyltransferase